MGCRTRANEYYRAQAPAGQIEGNVVRQDRVREEVPVRIRRSRQSRMALAAARRLRQQKIRLIMAGVAAAGIIIFLCCCMLNSLEQNDKIAGEIYRLENEIEDMTIRNDAREYEINGSVDLNEVIRIATEELGMVRSQPAQVILYRAQDAEYLQQVAAVPMD